MWEFIADCGTCAVIFGVLGEGLEIAAKATKLCELKWIRFQQWLRTCPRLKHWSAWCEKHDLLIEIIGAVCWVLVVVGLMVEFGGNHEVKRIEDADNALLKNQAGQAIKEAEKAGKDAAHSRLIAANTESNNLVLRQKVIELELSEAPRAFERQSEAIRALSRFANQHVAIEYAADHEARRTAALIRFVVVAAGWHLTNQPSPNPLPAYMVEGVRIEERNSGNSAKALEDELSNNNIAASRMMVGLMGEPLIVVKVGFKPSRERSAQMIEDHKILNKIDELMGTPNTPERSKWLEELLKRRPTNGIVGGSFLGNGAGAVSPSILTNGLPLKNLLLWE